MTTYEKIIETEIRKGASLQEMADALKADLSFQDGFPFIENVEEWLAEMLKTGWATIEGEELIIWAEYF